MEEFIIIKMAGKFKLERIEAIKNPEIQKITSFLCQNIETKQKTPLGKLRKNKDGSLKPKKLSVDLKNEIIKNTQIYFFEKYEDNKLSCIKFDINEEIAEEILKKYKRNLEKSIISHDYQIIDFNINVELAEKTSIMSIEESKVNNLKTIKNLVLNCNHSSSDINYKKLDFYIIKTFENGEEIYFFEKYEKGMRLDKTRLLKIFTSKKEKRFNKVSGDEHLYLNYPMSCFLFNQKMYILRKPIFERIFDYETLYKAICSKKENINFVNELNLFDDTRKFEERLQTDNLNILRKFSHLMNYKKEIKLLVNDIEKVKKLLKDYKVKGIKIEDNHISMTQSNFQSILKFLDRGQREHPITKEKFDDNINVKEKK